MSGVYIHIPFCSQRCIYCDFHTGTNLQLKSRYVQALCRELHDRCEAWSEPVETVYLGGGTPSLLTCEELQQIFNTLSQVIDLNKVTEVTMECNPDDLSMEYVCMLQQFPINRISIGVQSFHDSDLEYLNRRHTAREAIEAVEHCRAAGFNNVSIDLMYALPGQTQQMWGESLQTALRLGVEHISAYSLMYEEHSALTSRMKRGVVKPLGDEESAVMFEQMVTALKQGGFEHYEISNFCRPGFASRHNSSYWHGIPYIGAGAGAHSYDGKVRRWNVANTQRYCEGVEQHLLFFDYETLTDMDRFNEMVFTSLRTREGVDLQALLGRFEKSWYEELMQEATPHLQNGLMAITNGRLHLTEAGIYVSDSVMSDLMHVE